MTYPWVKNTSVYHRRFTDDYRDRYSGEIMKTPNGRVIGKEVTYGHVSGGDRFKTGNKQHSPSEKKNYRFREDKFEKVSPAQIKKYQAV